MDFIYSADLAAALATERQGELRRASELANTRRSQRRRRFGRRGRQAPADPST
jgi:hypothetical protein